MKKRLLFLFFSCSLGFMFTPASLAAQVLPSPTINGPTGIIRIPSADVIPYKNMNVGADFGVAISSFSSGESAARYLLNLGTFNGVELGIVGGTTQGTSQVREGVFVNAKLALSTGDEPYPLLMAVGVENLFSYTQTDVYMVATKYMKQGPKVTFGFMADFPNNRFRPLGLLGVEQPLGQTLFLAADFMLGETLSQLNAGAKLYFTPIFSLNFYALNVLDSQQSKDLRSALLGFSWANPF